MKKRILALAFCAVVLSGFSGCKVLNAAANVIGRRMYGEIGAEIAEETDAFESVMEEDSSELFEFEEVDPDDFPEEPKLYADLDWKSVYIEEIQRRALEVPSSDADISDYPETYYVYDIDKDGIPELIEKRGDAEAVYEGVIFTCKEENGEAVLTEIGTVGLGHCSLLSCPDENGVFLYYGHMGFASGEKVRLENERLQSEELFFVDGQNDQTIEYPDANAYVPNAALLSGCEISKSILISRYEEIMIRSTEPIDVLPESERRENYLGEIIPDIIENNGGIFVCSADPYGPSAGYVTYQEFLTKLDVWGGTYEMEDYAYVDVNGVGEVECVMQFKEQGAEYPMFHMAVFSAQDDGVYAYIWHFTAGYTVLENGIFRGKDDWYPNQGILFDHGEAMMYYALSDEKHAALMPFME